jgi:hypothetical protein
MYLQVDTVLPLTSEDKQTIWLKTWRGCKPLPHWSFYYIYICQGNRWANTKCAVPVPLSSLSGPRELLADGGAFDYYVIRRCSIERDRAVKMVSCGLHRRVPAFQGCVSPPSLGRSPRKGGKKRSKILPGGLAADIFTLTAMITLNLTQIYT